MVELWLDFRHLTVVGLHDTGPWSLLFSFPVLTSARMQLGSGVSHTRDMYANRVLAHDDFLLISMKLTSVCTHRSNVTHCASIQLSSVMH